MGILSAMIRKELEQARNRDIIPFDEIVAGKEKADDFLENLVSSQELDQLDPGHALYTYAMNLVCLFGMEISNSKRLSKFASILNEAEDEYLPEGPPISPLTASFFNLWYYFDLAIGRDHETIGTCFLDVIDLLPGTTENQTVFDNMQNSRMGIYEHRGVNNELIILRELLTREIKCCICPAGYPGKTGEIWYARILPSPNPSLDYDIVMTTPYVILQNTKRDWIDYFERNSIGGDDLKLAEKLHKLMKFGKTRYYWHEYVMNAYVNSRRDVIYLTGIPDNPASLPHG